MIGVAAVVYGVVYVDVVLRARHAYLEGEKYWVWGERPEDYIRFLDGEMARKKAQLEGRLAQGKVTKDDFDRQWELIQFDRRQAAQESTWKYAYVWYETAVDLFSPPDSKWVHMARAKMPLAKERWKQELQNRKIRYEDYMLQ